MLHSLGISIADFSLAELDRETLLMECDTYSLTRHSSDMQKVWKMTKALW